MRAGIGRAVSVVAVFAVTFHTALWAAVAPVSTAPAVDPFTVICHSEAAQPADSGSDQGVPAPGHACDHCNLCSAATPPLPQTAFFISVEPAQVSQILRPASTTRHISATADPKLARGPPVFA